eukprot:m.14911 g.14911  ORF g.14911 m.14911 type:complete len:296 (-) comp6455_c0_seq1:165-1052(-)
MPRATKAKRRAQPIEEDVDVAEGAVDAAVESEQDEVDRGEGDSGDEQINDDDDNDDNDDDDGDEDGDFDGEGDNGFDNDEVDGDGEKDTAEQSASAPMSTSGKPREPTKKRAKVKISKLTPEELEEYNKAQARRGIIYFSSIPPYMKVAKLRHLMSQYGEVDRIFLQPEDPKARKQRIRNGGSKKMKYGEGWVEFLDKKIAKRVARALNATQVGGKRHNFHESFLWNMKYLSKFKWHHLTERIAYDKAVRDKRMQADMSQVQKETAFYIKQATRAKRIAHAKAKAQAQAEQSEEQ